jgi:CRP/FNR family transcriptional regulator
MEFKETGRDNGVCSVRKLQIFAELNGHALSALDNLKTQRVVYAATETIYQGGTPANAVYILRDGYVKLFKTTATGKDQIIRVVKPGEFFGFDGLVSELYNHSAVPLRQAEVCCIPVIDLEALGEYKPAVERLIMVRCIKELQHADERLLELGAKRSSERLASFLLEWCGKAEGSKWVPLVLSRLEIAQLLGLTIETVSRLFALWKREDVIREKHQNIQINDANRLKLLSLSH